MKKIIIIFVGWFLFQQTIHAQGIQYLSNLGQSSVGGSSIGSDSWFAADFITGTNTAGYSLDSIQLAMKDASGNPSGFAVMVYAADGGGRGAIGPGTSLGTLNGSDNPSTAGTYAYTPISGLTLLPSTYYYIVLTAGTTVASGAYGWSVTDTPSPGYNEYHWGGEIDFEQSNNGLNWNSTSGIYGQYAITATAVPEPSSLALIGLSSLLFIWRRK